MRIGIDFGGVLTETTTPPQKDFLQTPPREGSYTALVRSKVAGDIPILISKADNEEKEAKARLWLAHWGFEELFEGNIEFCREPNGKVAIAQCANIAVMIDDTARQLELLADIRHRLLFGSLVAPIGMVAIQDWAQAESVLAQIRDTDQF